jgi:hypothetical protein
MLQALQPHRAHLAQLHDLDRASAQLALRHRSIEMIQDEFAPQNHRHALAAQ